MSSNKHDWQETYISSAFGKTQWVCRRCGGFVFAPDVPSVDYPVILRLDLPPLRCDEIVIRKVLEQ